MDAVNMSKEQLIAAMRRNDEAQEQNHPDSSASREARVQNRALWSEAQKRGYSQQDCGY